jgi:hypothetical protein
MAELPGTSSRQRWTLVLVCTAAFMLLLDVTVVSVALPSIQRDLRASLPDLQWVSAAYALVLAVLLLPAATLGDRLGRRRLARGVCLRPFRHEDASWVYDNGASQRSGRVRVAVRHGDRGCTAGRADSHNLTGSVLVGRQRPRLHPLARRLSTARTRSDDLDDAVRAFLALALTSAGREREAGSVVLAGLAPHLTRYNRSLAAYAKALVEPGTAE